MTPAELEKVKAEVRRRLEEKRKRLLGKPIRHPPRYDDVFWKGTDWLDAIARGEIPQDD